MKLTDYINELQKIVDEQGDMDCVTWVEDMDARSGGYFESVEKKYVLKKVRGAVSDFACVYTDRNGNKEYATINDRGYIDCKREKVFIVEESF